MVRNIKFPLDMGEGVKVRTLEDLQENFNLEKVLGYYMDGRLLTWLSDRYYEDEVSQISSLDKNAADFKGKLCEILGVEIEFDEEIDLETMERRNVRIAKLKQFTDDETILKNIDYVAFHQEEMADLLDENISPIYLCGKKFTIPVSKENVTYIGVNSPVVVIKSKSAIDFDSKHIVFQNIIFDEEYRQIIFESGNIFVEESDEIRRKYKMLDYMMESTDRVASEKLFGIIKDEIGCIRNDNIEPFEFYKLVLRIKIASESSKNGNSFVRQLMMTGICSGFSYTSIGTGEPRKNTPLHIIFHNQAINRSAECILQEDRIGLWEWNEKYSSANFNDIEIKVKATKDFIEECKKTDNRKKTLKFVFWSLLVFAVSPKTDWDKKISLIAAFSYLLEIDEKTLFDITQVVRVVLGAEDKNIIFQVKEVSSVFERVALLVKWKGC